MKLTITQVTPVYPRRVYVQWSFAPTPGMVGPYTFEVQRSASPEGPWLTMDASIIDAVGFFDTTALPDRSESINTSSLTRSIYYRVKVTTPTNLIAYADPVNLDGERAGDTKQMDQVEVPRGLKRFLIRRKILRDEQLSFKVFNGIEVAVLKKKHFGVRCTQCFDPVTKLNIKSRCAICYGTGWEGGYHPPILSLARFAASSTVSQLTSEGKSDINNNGVTLLNYPHVEEGDLIVELGGNHRWLVKNVNPTEIRRITVHQRIVGTELPRTSPEFNIPLGGPYAPL